MIGSTPSLPTNDVLLGLLLQRETSLWVAHLPPSHNCGSQTCLRSFVTVHHLSYDDVGVKHVHLNMQTLKLSGADTALGLSSSATAVTLNVTLAVNLTGFYRLCIHDDPFSKHACSAIDDCKGAMPPPPSHNSRCHALAVTQTGTRLLTRSLP